MADLNGKLIIEYVPIDELKPYANNAKLHPAEQIEQIKKSIQDYGFKDPVGVWKNEIVEGHGRVIAAQELGITEVPIIRLDDLTDEQRREYALVHNQTTMNSGFDFSILNGELEGLPDFDAEFYGFERDAIAESDIDAGEVEDKTDAKIAVKIVFESLKKWRFFEDKVRSFVDEMEGVSVSVGEYNEDK